VFLLGCLPLPVPLPDGYGKAGLAGFRQSADAGLGCCGLGRSECESAWGAGAQIKAGAIAVRIEFERYRAAGGQMNLASAGVLWRFP
jgi:hypothetical protein